MRTRRLGKTGYEVSEVGFGAWAIGGSWGETDDDASMSALHAAADAGVNFIDTADVYGDGHSERLIAKLRSERDERLYVATKLGRRGALDPSVWTLAQFRSWADRSRENLEMETLDLIQLHCLPGQIYQLPQVWEALDALVAERVIAHYGVSVETVDEGLAATRQPGIASVQIIFNAFRQKPAESFLAAAAAADVGVIARVPLASGLLTGKFTADSTFSQDDHRNFNRHGESFDMGETFSGVDYDTGLEAVERLRPLVPGGATMAQFALRWILMHSGLTTVIPGAKRADQAEANAAAADLAPLPDEVMREVRAVYDELIAPQVHHRW
ncbi:MAG TPA: aldo/keto reductase [Egibacteraceae bacterium]|nr:aldo/keto reductase [Egibacteraceae bacterium]